MICFDVAGMANDVATTAACHMAILVLQSRLDIGLGLNRAIQRLDIDATTRPLIGAPGRTPQ
jgi:hypothetical protein